MAQVTISGKYAVAYTSTESATGVKASGFRTTDGDVVFSGAEDIGGGMKAGASLALKLRGRDSAVTATTTTTPVIEGVVASTTVSGAASDNVNGRDATVYLQGGFGRITLGSIEAGNGIIGRASAGAGIIGQDSGTVLDGAANVDMASLSLPIGAVTATVMLIDSIGNPGAGGMQAAAATQDATLFGLAYAAGPISVGLDQTNFGRNAAAATATDTRTRVSASYDLGVARIGAGYQTKETYAGVADTQMMFGVTVPMGAITLGANYATRDNDNNALDASGYEVGGSYAFSKRTALAAYYMSQELDAAANATTQLRVRLIHSF
jgi:predicted porin